MDINDDPTGFTSRLTIAQARTEWDVQTAFLDSCSYGPPPRRGWDALQRSLDEWRAGSVPWPQWAESVDTSRELFGRLVGVLADQVATGAAVSQLLAPIAAALPDGAEVLIPEIEFTSGVYPFAVHADRGVRVRTAPLDTLAEAVDESTTLVYFSAAQSATGEVADVPAIISAAREVGAFTVLDGTQAAGWLPLNASEVDFLAVAAYKWLCAPRGTAFLTMPSPVTVAEGSHPRRAEFFDRLKPLAAGWFAAGGAASYGMPMHLADGARAFDISPAWHSWVGTAPALELLLDVGIDQIHTHDIALANRFRTGLGLAESNSAIVSIELGIVDRSWPGAPDRLDAARVRYSQAGGNMRFGFHLFNDESDVDTALNAVTDYATA
ncbi:aminotransferase class V-fold PLP-dependent enzyme [Brevibacterium sediminis]|uniref:Aminotransferase class V-fold PLP-dependent enzyme n=1 Tax=Brevibacterium sediminis TaxID=1857024 RepID=A0A5C4X3H0_9MICO|nr:aminotransferase class V-fold PLP-dependent enzyme [Brevibacterium sediminis]TNM56118.1 aminotransferase class V-fold PLP-dependent enzyme [Brevibacterium sediminis]